MKNTLEPHQPLWGGIEAGGTKFNCVISDDNGNIVKQALIPTTIPNKTLAEAKDFFTSHLPAGKSLAGLGIASFGPVDLNPESLTYGFITKTPKAGWSNTNLVGYFKDALNIPIGFETDVNGAALGEWMQGAAIGCHNFVYVTVGTGIGAGVFMGGKLLQGISHPEVGHMLIPQKTGADNFQGACPFHANCLEGLASGTAINMRWKEDAKNLSLTHPAWKLEAFYLACMCVNLTMLYAPEKIILGGGVMEQTHLFEDIRKEFKQLIAGYASDSVLNNMERYIVSPGLQGKSGITGALALAKNAYKTI